MSYAVKVRSYVYSGGRRCQTVLFGEKQVKSCFNPPLS